uniref:Uncharacterized protein n=1 Tax=Astyanax mexicanus TaxID=7994 RepID=A0A8B9GP99_ASTMX
MKVTVDFEDCLKDSPRFRQANRQFVNGVRELALQSSRDDVIGVRHSICLSVCLSVCLYVYLSVCLSVCMSVYLSVCLCMSICMSICLSVCLSVCLSISLSLCSALIGCNIRSVFLSFL